MQTTNHVDESQQMINRREALKRTAAIMGGLAYGPALLAFLQGCSRQRELGFKPEFLNEEQARVVAEIAEIIIPRTDTPGALDAGVPAFIDSALAAVYPVDAQVRFTDGLKAFEDGCVQAHGRAFLKLGADDRLAYVRSAHDAAVPQDTGVSEERPFILMLKELTLLGFFTSEVGATQVLQYQQVPGLYRSCVPVEEAGNGKRWAT